MRNFGLAFLLLSACSEQNFTKHTVYGASGDSLIAGRVCDAASQSWVEDAVVYTNVIDDEDRLLDTRQDYTDQDGRWKLEDLPGGEYTIYVQKGPDMLDMFDVELDEGEELDLDEGTCTGSAATELAVVTGDYDNMGEVLTSLGYDNARIINGKYGDELLQFLESTTLGAYDAIFFAGGHVEEDLFYDSDGSDVDGHVALIKDNLKAYVESGGVVFASDWSYDVVERVWPNKIEFYGDDDTPDAAQVGEPTTVDADITSSSLKDAVGEETVRVKFDLDAWPIATSKSDDVKVYQKADVPWRVGEDSGTESGAPLLLDFPVGDGRVVFSSWRLAANAEGKGEKVIQYMIER